MENWILGCFVAFIGALISFVLGMEPSEEMINKIKKVSEGISKKSPVITYLPPKNNLEFKFNETPKTRKRRTFKKPEKTTGIRYEPFVNKKYLSPNEKVSKLNKIKKAKFDGYDKHNGVEKLCKFCIDAYFDLPFMKERPEWLINNLTGHRMELDLYNPTIILIERTPQGKTVKWTGLALEYQGVTHYQYPHWISQTEENFFKGRERDKLKKKICIERRVKLIEIPFTVKNEDIAMYLYNMLDDLGYKSKL